jgi:hypothetical protein
MSLEICCLPPENPLASELIAAAANAAARLDLARYLNRIELCLDDLEPDRRIWLDLRPAPDRREAATGVHELTLYLHPQHVARDRPPTSELFGARPVWEPRTTLPEAPHFGPADFQRAKAERFLLHHFLFVRDICDGSLDLTLVPSDLAEAFQEAWSTTVDGRLRRWRLAAASLAERRVSFSRLFSRHGVLLPDHWRIFHQLWEREDLDVVGVVELLRRLPWRRR